MNSYASLCHCRGIWDHWSQHHMPLILGLKKGGDGDALTHSLIVQLEECDFQEMSYITISRCGQQKNKNKKLTWAPFPELWLGPASSLWAPPAPPCLSELSSSALLSSPAPFHSRPPASLKPSLSKWAKAQTCIYVRLTVWINLKFYRVLSSLLPGLSAQCVRVSLHPKSC